MPNDKQPAWHAARVKPKPTAPKWPRALDPDTNLPYGRTTLIQKAKLKTMKELIRPLINKWLPRQLLKLLAPFATLIGATSEGTQQTVMFITAAAAWLVEVTFSWTAVKMMKRNAAKAAAQAGPALILLLALCTTVLPSCRATAPAGHASLKAGTAIIRTGNAPANLVNRRTPPLPAPAHLALLPFTMVPMAAGLLAGTPFCAAGLLLIPGR